MAFDINALMQDPTFVAGMGLLGGASQRTAPLLQAFQMVQQLNKDKREEEERKALIEHRKAQMKVAEQNALRYAQQTETSERMQRMYQEQGKAFQDALAAYKAGRTGGVPAQPQVALVQPQSAAPPVAPELLGEADPNSPAARLQRTQGDIAALQKEIELVQRGTDSGDKKRGRLDILGQEMRKAQAQVLLAQHDIARQPAQPVQPQSAQPPQVDDDGEELQMLGTQLQGSLPGKAGEALINLGKLQESKSARSQKQANERVEQAFKERQVAATEAARKLAEDRFKWEKEQGNKPPVGFRKTEEGGLEPIPGGPAASKEEEKQQGIKNVDTFIKDLRQRFDALATGGGIVDPEKGTLENIGAGVASSLPGQFTGRLVGTKNQSERNAIAMTRPLLLQAIMKATGMTAKQMDSNVELQLYLSAATDPSLDIRANRLALDRLQELYGSGKGKNTGGFEDAEKERRYQEWKTRQGKTK